MSARRFWFVSLTMILLCGCGRQSAPLTAPPTSPAQAVTGPRDTDEPAATGQRPAEDGTDAARPPAAALADLRATLDRAFVVLRKQSIVAEPNFEDCARCAVVAMSQLLDDRNAPGGVYWHEQDDENLERGEDLNIGFLAREDRDAAAIAEILVAALKAEGLTVEWDGTPNQRVTVKVPWSKPEARAADPPLVRLERVAQIPGTEQGLQGDLAVHGKYVYWTLAGRLRVIDVSEPSKPRVVGTLEIENMAEWVSVSGRYAYVGQEQRLLVVDISDPAALHVAGSCDLGVDIWHAAVQGNYAYVTSAGSVLVIDVSDAEAPKVVGRGAVECGEGITVVGKYAYLACDEHGLHIVDISDPHAPQQVGTFRGTDGAMNVTVAGKIAYITSMENDVFGLYIVDVSDPASPKQVVRFGDWMTGGIAVQGHYAYLASGNLSVLDVANPAAPKELCFFDAPEDPATIAWRVAVAGDYVYVLGDGKQGFSILRVVRTRK